MHGFWNLGLWLTVVSTVRRWMIVYALGAVLISSCASAEPTGVTYADENGFLWYATDCPDADILLLAGADGLPARETTERVAVESFAEGTEYQAVPRNGWVWERLADGSVLVSQVEDYMLERTIESADQCPSVSSHNGMGIPVAYRIAGD